MPSNSARACKRLAAVSLVATACFVCSWLLTSTTGQPEEATLSVAVTSTPSLERIRPTLDRASLTFAIFLHGKPLEQGHVKVQLMAPPPMQVLSTGFPWVEGSPLLVLDSEFGDGTFTLQYTFPIRGIYTFDLEITSVPEGPAFPPTSLRKTVRISENPVVARNAWLLIGGLFIFGGIIGAMFARSAAAREKLLRCAITGPLLLYCGALGPVHTVAAHGGHTEGASYNVLERQIIRGDDGWELEIHASPMPAIVGHLVHLAIWLRKDGEVFLGMTKVATTVTSLEEGQTVVETNILARQGHIAQSLQLYDGAPHTIAVTVRPVGSDARGWLPPTAVLNVDVVTLPPPVSVQLRMLAMLVGVLVVGMVVGFCVPRMYKEPTSDGPGIG